MNFGSGFFDICLTHMFNAIICMTLVILKLVLHLSGFRLADLAGIQIGNATTEIYKGAFGDRVYHSNLNEVLLKANRRGK
jgi:hypothetical protein